MLKIWLFLGNLSLSMLINVMLIKKHMYMYLITSMQNFRKILKVYSHWRVKAESG